MAKNCKTRQRVHTCYHCGKPVSSQPYQPSAPPDLCNRPKCLKSRKEEADALNDIVFVEEGETANATV